MASSSGTSVEQRRWLVVGIALQNVLTPCLRDKVQDEMTPFYQHVVRHFGLDKQTYAAFQKTIPSSTLKLNYDSINNNAALHPGSRHHYDYCVNDEVSLAKLFMKPFMAKFNAFDSSFDASAALAVLCGAPPFTAVKPFAEDVRSKVRNEWAHCDFAAWTEANYDSCFDLMEALVTNLAFSPADEAAVVDKLKLWRTQGIEICLGKPLDDTLLGIIRDQIQSLSDSLDDYSEKQDSKVLATIELFKSEIDKEVALIQEKQSCLEERFQMLQQSQDVMKEEMSTKDKEQKERLRISEILLKLRQKQVERFCETLEVKSSVMQKDLELLKTTIDNISPSEDPKQPVFDAPEQNKWFTGRQHEMEVLERCLTFESDGSKMAAICGLGGCGKTTLATNFAWKRKSDYNGGIFWISMEDNRKFESTVNDLALRLEVRANSFDFTLSKVLTWISKQKKPWLLVLDDVDQLNLSDQMQKVLSGRWKRQTIGHLLLTTRREQREISECLDLEPPCCVNLHSFTDDEAEKFLLTRCGFHDTTGQVETLNELIHELGCLPLALEQAGAHIKALQCPISKYLEEYKSQRLKLLSQHPAQPSWEYECQSRLAVHTTWLLNFEHVRNSVHGQVASRFVQAAAFLAPDEIQEELINPQLLSEDQSDQSSNLPLMKYHIVEILAKFSLFQRKTATTLGLHRLVQEVIRNRMTIEENASSLLLAIRLVHHCFRDCPSPDQILTDVAESMQREQPSASVADPSLFYLWSKLTSHASELQNHLMAVLDRQDIAKEVKSVVLTRETSRVIYENAVNLSVHGHQEEAKETEQFALQILDSRADDSVALSSDELMTLFPHNVPLPQMIQKTILYSSRPPVENQKFAANENHQSAAIDAIRLRGNSFFKDGLFNEAVECYTEAIEASKETKLPDPRLFNNRATAYLKLGKFEECLQDSEKYINMMPNCWKGYSRKALALNELGKKRPALCAAAVAYYHDAKCCRSYEAFRNAFRDLDGNWEVIDSSEALQRSLTLNKSQLLRKEVLLLKDGKYEMPDVENRIDITTGHGATIYKFPSIKIEGTTLVALGNGADVTITCGMILFCGECFSQHITFSTKESLMVASDGHVEFYKCSFRNSVSNSPVITICGAAAFFECTVQNSEGSGIGVSGVNSSLVLVNSRISGNGTEMNPYAYGVRVFDQAYLLVHECHIHGNTRGIWIDEGPSQSVPAKGAMITCSEIYDNKYEGVVVGGFPGSISPVVIMRKNKIYHNGTFGIRATLNINDVLVEDNMIFENYWWGVCVHNDSGGHYRRNEICYNKMGGIKVSKRSPRKPPSVVENNVIHDNCGPAFYEGLRSSECDSFPRELHMHFKGLLDQLILGPLNIWK